MSRHSAVVAGVAGSAIAIVLATGCGRYGFDGEAGDGVDASGGVTERCADIPGALVCSSFEDDMDEWTFETQGSGEVVPTCPSPRTGQGCLTASIDQGGHAARAYQRYPAQGEGTTLYARFHVRFDDPVSILGVNVGTVDSENTSVYGPDFNLVDEGMFELYIEQEDEQGGQIGPIPRNEWVCLHLEMFVDDSAGSATAGYNNSSARRSNIDTFPDGPYDYVAVGIDWSDNQQEAIALAIDDIVVATSPVPCGS